MRSSAAPLSRSAALAPAYDAVPEEMEFIPPRDPGLEISIALAGFVLIFVGPFGFFLSPWLAYPMITLGIAAFAGALAWHFHHERERERYLQRWSAYLARERGR